MIILNHIDCLEYLETFGEVDAFITDVPFGLKGEESFEISLQAIKMVKCKIFVIITDWRNSSLISGFSNKVGELIWEYGWISGG